MIGHLAKQRNIRFLETMLILRGLVYVANAAAGGKDSGTLKDLVNEYKALVYPETAHEIEDAVKRTETILATEFSRGPMKVQAQEYGKKRRKKGR